MPKHSKLSTPHESPVVAIDYPLAMPFGIAGVDPASLMDKSILLLKIAKNL